MNKSAVHSEEVSPEEEDERDRFDSKVTDEFFGDELLDYDMLPGKSLSKQPSMFTNSSGGAKRSDSMSAGSHSILMGGPRR